MREGWRRVALGEIATRRKDFTPVDAATMYRIVGVQRSGWGLVDRDPARGDSMKFDKLMRLNAKDLVYRTITAFEAPSTVVDESFAGAFVTPNTFPVYALDQTQLLPSYMALLTTDPGFHEAMASRTVGSVLRRKTLSQKAFESIPIDLPPLVEQRRIVDLIAAVDDAIEAAEEEADHSTDLMATLANGATGDVQPLSDVIAGIDAGKSPRSEDRVPRAGERAVLKVSAIGDRTFEPREAKALSDEMHMPDSILVQDGDLLLTRASGAIDRVGVTCIVRDVPPLYYLSDKTLRIRVNAERGDARWVHYMLGATMARRQISALATGSDMRNLAQARIREINIPLPSVDEQREGARRLDALAAAAEAASAEADRLRVLRSNLLTALLSGEHEIPASYDRFIEEAA